MKAVGLYKYLPIDDAEALIDVEIDSPRPQGRDLLVEVKAISVNPVDTKVRAPKADLEESPKILGWDAAGTVIAVGDAVEHFAIGDKVFYAGDITRPGSNSEYQCVDERIVGHMPQSLSFASAAALPLTAITAWEGLFERLGIDHHGADAGKSILIINGAGGVGSIATQLARKLARLNVIATASRTETVDWCKKHGAGHCINHHKPMDTELDTLGLKQVDYIFCLNNTDQHWEMMCQLIAPQGKICSIVETAEPVNLDLLKSKSATFVWEFMYTRSMFQTEDMIAQQQLLDTVAEHVDQGTLVSTVNQVISPINAENLRKAHKQLESGTTIGKLVLENW